MAGSILGNRVLRKEDPKFLTTGGVYVDDQLDEPLLAGAAHVTYVRSTVAHGVITGIDTSAALAMPGVLAIFTAADLELQPTPSDFNPMVARGLLAIDKVRFVGEPVAVVVTEQRQQGEDAAEQVVVDYDVLPAVMDMEAALTSTTLLYDSAGSNVVFDTMVLGLPDNTGAAFFEGCDVVSGPHRILNQRVAPCPLEVRGSAVAWVPTGDGVRLHQWLSTQAAQGAKTLIAKVNGVEPDQVLVIAPDVGGGFGAKISCDPEESLLGVIAKKVGRPLRWRETRTESMMALGHGRAQVQYVTIGGSRDGKVSHYQLHAIQDAGYFAEMGTILAPFMTRPMSSAVYAIPNIECRTTSVLTNAAVTTAYRGAGRPEATAAAERAMDLFALEIGMDPTEVRRANLIPKFMEPHTTAVGQTYDVGDYATALDKALAAAGYAELRADQARRRAAGDVKQLGIGVSTYVEITGGVGSGEHAKIEVLDNGRAVVYTGTSPHGQGHVTAWSMLAHEQTGIPMDQIDVVWGNTDLVPLGDGTMGSRSLQQGGNAVFLAAADLVTKARGIAARLLEADEADVVLDKDTASFHVAGTPSVAKSWADLAVAARKDPELPEGLARRGVLRRRRGDVPVRCARRCRRGGHRDRPRPPPASHRLRRCGHGPQPDAARGPDPRRRRAGHRAGVDGGGALRLRRQPRHVEPRRLCLHLRRRAPEHRGGAHANTDVHQHAGRQGHRRERHHRQHAGRAVRGDRRRQPPRRAPHRHAVLTSEGVAGDPDGERFARQLTI